MSRIFKLSFNISKLCVISGFQVPENSFYSCESENPKLNTMFQKWLIILKFLDRNRFCVLTLKPRKNHWIQYDCIASFGSRHTKNVLPFDWIVDQSLSLTLGDRSLTLTRESGRCGNGCRRRPVHRPKPRKGYKGMIQTSLHICHIIEFEPRLFLLLHFLIFFFHQL